MSLRGRDLLTLRELSTDEVHLILARAAEMKRGPGSNGILAGRMVALLFSKPSTRTRVSFEAGVRQLGGSTIFLGREDIQVGRGETLSDTGRVLSLYTDALVMRTYRQKDVEELAEAATVPVINALTDEYHPCQILADLMTLKEIWGRLKGLRLAYVGDGNNVANTLVIGCGLMEIELRLACPRGYKVSSELIKEARSRWSAHVTETEDPMEAVTGVDAIYTDTWASMGQEQEKAARLKVFGPYQVNSELLRAAGSQAKVLHCLPAHRGEEITAEVLDGPQSVVWQQAENRLHAQKALLSLLLER